MQFSLIAALVGLATADGVKKGFNSGSYGPRGKKLQSDFEAEFRKIQNLAGAPGFTSARLYTTIQADTANDPTSAIDAAIATKTDLVLGLWASAGQDAFNQELTALRRGLDQHGQDFIDRIIGICIGSEDVYRTTPTGIQNLSGAGATPEDILKYIQQVRDLLNGYNSPKNLICHVDTWDAWVLPSMAPVVDAVDYIGMNTFPYWQWQFDNRIENAASLFFDAYDKTVAIAKGKSVHVTETGWPSRGPESGQAHANIESAKRYWDDVGCKLFGNINTWWFTLDDAKADPNALSWSTVGPDLGDPLFDLSCPAPPPPPPA